MTVHVNQNNDPQSTRKFEKYTVFSSAIFRLPIPTEEKLVLICFHQYQNSEQGIFPSLKKIGLDCSFSRYKASDCVKKLEELGYLSIQKCRAGGKFTQNIYAINYDKIETDSDNVVPFKKTNRVDSSRVVPDRVAMHHVAGSHTNNNSVLKNNSSMNTNSCCSPPPAATTEQQQQKIEKNKTEDSSSEKQKAYDLARVTKPIIYEGTKPTGFLDYNHFLNLEIQRAEYCALIEWAIGNGFRKQLFEIRDSESILQMIAEIKDKKENPPISEEAEQLALAQKRIRNMFLQGDRFEEDSQIAIWARSRGLKYFWTQEEIEMENGGTST